MSQIIPFRKQYLGDGVYYYDTFNPSGKWRIVYSPDFDDPVLELEHQGWLFKSWVSEYDLEFRNKHQIFENTCT